MYIIKIIIILIKTQGCHYDFKLLGVSKLDFRQRIKELYVGSYFAFVFLTLFLMKVLVVGGGSHAHSSQRKSLPPGSK